MTVSIPTADSVDAPAACPEGHRAGFVALVGRPNAGKSTLLNQLLGQKLAITSPLPQTTRNRILGIMTRPASQVVLLDTPGIHKARSRINKAMVHVAESALSEVDLACWLVDAVPATRRISKGGPALDRGHEAIAQIIARAPSEPTVLIALNKADVVKKPHLLPLIAGLAELVPGAEIVPISALTGDGVERLVETWLPLLPEAPPFYSAETWTDASERFIVSELIREKIFRLTTQEIPYATCVEIEQFDEEKREENGRVIIFARILVERDSQKGIIIGKGGEMLKRIGQQARRDINALLGVRAHLDLHVSVASKWSEDPRRLRNLGTTNR